LQTTFNLWLEKLAANEKQIVAEMIAVQGKPATSAVIISPMMRRLSGAAGRVTYSIKS